MSLKADLPGARQAIVEAGGTPSRPLYVFLQRVATTVDGLSASSGDVTIPELPISENANVVGASGFSVYTQGTLKTGIVRVLLMGDTQAPGNTQYYGSGPTGERGWFDVSDALAESGNVTLTVGADGVTTFDLADLADSGTGDALVKITRDAKGRIAGTSAATTSDLAEGSNLYFTDARADARVAAAKADPNGVASLVSGKLDAGQLPALAITETFVVADDASMLALTAQEGDVAVRTDLNQSFILTAEPASTLSNWQELLVPTAGVTSFNGRTGSVTPASGDYTPAQVGAEPAITAGTTSQYRRGDKTWRDFATDVRAAVLTGLSTATSAVITAADTVLGALGKLQAQITDNLLPKGYIDGLQMVWVSGTALTVTSGAAYIEGASKVLRATADIAKTGLSLSASTWYHVYLYDNAGTPDVEISTTAPAAAYNGTARAKTGDTGRRYVGSFKTDGSGAIYPFRHDGDGRIYFVTSIDTFKVLVGNATTATSVFCSSFVPVTGKRAFANIINNDTTHVAWLGNSNSPPSSINYMELIGTGAGGMTVVTEIVLDSSQAFQYLMATGATASLVVRLKGYLYER